MRINLIDFNFSTGLFLLFVGGMLGFLFLRNATQHHHMLLEFPRAGPFLSPEAGGTLRHFVDECG